MSSVSLTNESKGPSSNKYLRNVFNKVLVEKKTVLSLACLIKFQRTQHFCGNRNTVRFQIYIPFSISLVSNTYDHETYTNPVHLTGLTALSKHSLQPRVRRVLENVSLWKG